MGATVLLGPIQLDKLPESFPLDLLTPGLQGRAGHVASICPSVRLSVHSSTHSSVHRPIYVSIRLSTCLSVSLPVLYPLPCLELPSVHYSGHTGDVRSKDPDDSTTVCRTGCAEGKVLEVLLRVFRRKPPQD